MKSKTLVKALTKVNAEDPEGLAREILQQRDAVEGPEPEYVGQRSPSRARRQAVRQQRQLLPSSRARVCVCLCLCEVATLHLTACLRLYGLAWSLCAVLSGLCDCVYIYT